MNICVHITVMLLLLNLCLAQARAQIQETIEDVSTDVGTVVPEAEVPVDARVRLNPMPRGLEFTYEMQGRATVSNTPTAIALGEGTDSVRYERMEMKLKVPIYLRPATQVIIGARYAIDRFAFEDGATNPIYAYMHRRRVNIKTATLYLNKYFKKRYFLSTRTEYGLFGEHRQLGIKQTYRFSQSFLLGRHINKDLAYGIGIYLTAQYHRQSFYPVIYYQRNFSEKTGFSTMFPANAHLRYMPDDKTFLQLGYEVHAMNYAFEYNIDAEPVLRGADFRRSFICPEVRADRELYDFLWASVALGWCKTVKADIQIRDAAGRHRLSDLSYGNPFSISASLFLTIPRKYRNKLV